MSGSQYTQSDSAGGSTGTVRTADWGVLGGCAQWHNLAIFKGEHFIIFEVSFYISV